MHLLEQSSSRLESASIPLVSMLDRVINLKFGAPVDNWLEKALLTPMSEIMGRPSKQFRALLVNLGCLLSSQYSDLTDIEYEPSSFSFVSDGLKYPTECEIELSLPAFGPTAAEEDGTESRLD